MKRLIGLLTAKILTSIICGIFSISLISTVVAAEQDKKQKQNFKQIRADILSTITSINEIRLMLIAAELKDSKNASNKTVSKLSSSVSANNRTLKGLSNETKNTHIRLALLENRTFSKAENDFNDYVSSTSKKVFALKLVQNQRGSIECDAVSDTYTYSRTENNNGIDIIETITRHDNTGKICFERDVMKLKTHTKLLYISNQNKILNDYPVNDLVTYNKPVVLLTSSMENGKSFGSGGTITYKSNGSTNTLVFNKVSTLLDTEAEISLTVNQAQKTYSNCLIIGTRNNSTVSTEWYCPGDGLVKRVIFFPSAENKPARSEISTLQYIAEY